MYVSGYKALIYFLIVSSTREDAHRRTGDRKAYVFDLDVHETGSDDEDDGCRYSVDSYRAGECRISVHENDSHEMPPGNWSRFIKYVRLAFEVSLI